jgi:uncharacterized protein (DUF488 family)
VIYSIGHSTHALEDFVALLRAHDIVCVADVRTVPRSRRVPHFNADVAGAALKRFGVEYVSMPQLGGLRKARPDSPNAGWRVDTFRGYADYMGTPEFARALDDLRRIGSQKCTAYMCAEGLWWKCHRRLISDALLVRGEEVKHVLPNADLEPHALSPFAVVEDGRITYPPAQSSLDV